MNFPILPVIASIGRKATIVVRWDAVTGATTSIVPSTVAFNGDIPDRFFTYTFSAITMPSSTSMPSTIIIAQSESMLRV